MRTYAPADVASVLAGILDEPSLARGVLHHAVEPAREAITVPFPDWLDPRIRSALATRGIDALYTHQGEALAAVHAGRDVCVVTPTASGKSLCYELPVLQALADDPSARALWLFPTKALGQDQVVAFRELAAAAGLPASASTYDGDTPAPIRSTIRTAGQVVVTNPDMLHAAILPHHTKWFQLFEQVRVIVVDELHTYRGLFGSHAANVLRRLLRLCAHYGSNPVVITCSATIANPGELAELLTGRPPLVVDRNGAPSGERHLLFVDPPVIDAASGARGSALRLAQRWALPFIRAGRQTIVFGPSRTGVEVILSGLRESLRESRGPRTRVRGYRGGYLPTERRAIEAGLRDGEVLGVVEHERPRARCGHRGPRRGDPGRLSGFRGGHPAAGRAGGPPPRHERRRPRRLRVSRRPVRRPPPGVPARACPRRGPHRSGQPAHPARPSEGGHVRAAVLAGRYVRAERRRRSARLPGRGGARPRGRRRPVVLELRELPRLRDLTANGGPGERRHHRHDARPAARARRSRPLLGPGARPPARHLHARVDPVPRRPARVGRAQGVCPPHRRRPLHVREPGGDAEDARHPRERACPGRPARARRGDGGQPRRRSTRS